MLNKWLNPRIKDKRCYNKKSENFRNIVKHKVKIIITII